MINKELAGRFALGLLVGCTAFSFSIARADTSDLRVPAYEDEMHRCIDMLRPVITSMADGKVVYDIQDIDKRGPWYRFEISIDAKNEAGEGVLEDYRIGCRANRYIEVASLLERRNKNELPAQTELFASK